MTDQTETTTTNEPQPLTAMDLRALREADVIVMSHTPDGQGNIRCLKTLAKPTPWEKEAVYSIDVLSWLHTCSYSPNPYTNACTSFGANEYNERWQTIARLLKVGDTVSLLWSADNNNGYLDDAQLHNHELDIEIHRKGQAKPLRIYIDHRIGPANSASMIR